MYVINSLGYVHCTYIARARDAFLLFLRKTFFFCFSFFFFLSINWILNADFSLIRVRRVYICLVTSKTIRFRRKTPLYSEAFSQAIRAYAVRLKLNIYVYFVYLLLCIHAKHRRGKKIWWIYFCLVLPRSLKVLCAEKI